MEGLIEAQRRLSVSKNKFEQVIGTLYVAGLLKQRLAELPNDAIGHLMEFVSNELGAFSPELVICVAAIERLFRPSPVLVRSEKENLKS